MNTFESSKPDWKKISASEGYRLFKDGYCNWLAPRKHFSHSKAKKAEYRTLFFRIIGLAFHVSNKTGYDVSEILKEWELARSYNWVNYYTNALSKYKIPKIRTKIRHNYSVKLLKRHGYSAKRAFERFRADKETEAKIARKRQGKKARWYISKKKSAKRYKELKAKYPDS